MNSSLVLPDGGWNFDNSYSRLPDMLFSRVAPESVAQPAMAIFNRALAASLGLDADQLTGEVGIFAGNKSPSGADPLAQAYAGHQFGHFNNLGDGRAILVGEHIDPLGARWDVQWKGSGRTPYSRRGDGRAALGPMLREYIISEAMHALGIPTTRSLAVVATGETISREFTLPGAVLTRVAASHIRVGTFEYAAAIGRVEVLQALLDYTCRRHYPEAMKSENPAIFLLEGVMERQASLIARWMLVGFVHGVMNTDNMALSGETIDYGPCAFIDAYDSETVFSSIDRGGRYAFGNQSSIAHWNLARLAEALLPLLAKEEKAAIEKAEEVLAKYPQLFKKYWLAGMHAKIGLMEEVEGDEGLIQDLLETMRVNRADFTNTFRQLHPTTCPDSPFLHEWHTRWVARLGNPGGITDAIELMNQTNPAVIPRNHLVEEALEEASTNQNPKKFHQLLEVLQKPYEKPADAKFESPAPEGSPHYRTFCGT
jgi:uncharacterized protein YdiU (UPF0061 family)